MKPTKINSKIQKRMNLITQIQIKQSLQTPKQHRIKPKTKTEKKKQYDQLIKEVPEHEFTIISQVVKNELCKKLPHKCLQHDPQEKAVCGTCRDSRGSREVCQTAGEKAGAAVSASEKTCFR